jgi:hypothetical protein
MKRGLATFGYSSHVLAIDSKPLWDGIGTRGGILAFSIVTALS